MANYATLKAAIQQVIKTNGNEEITGALLQQSLLAMINSLGDAYQFVGLATPATVPGSPDNNVAYLAFEPGAYPNFGSGVTLSFGQFAVFKYNGSWHFEISSVFLIDEQPTYNSDHLAKSGGIYAMIYGNGTETTRTYTNAGYIRYSDGQVVTGNTWVHSDFIPVKEIKSFGDLVTSGVVANIGYYSAANYNSYISGEQMAGNKTKADLTIPSNAKYAVFSTNGQNKTLTVTTIVYSGGIVQMIEQIAETALTTSDIVDNLTSGGHNKPLSAEQGKILGAIVNGSSTRIVQQYSNAGYIRYSDGQVVTGNTWVHSDKIPIAWFVSATYLLFNASVATVAFYDANQNYISGINSGTGIGNTATPQNITIPSNAAYIAFSTNATGTTTLSVTYDQITPGMVERMDTLEQQMAEQTETVQHAVLFSQQTLTPTQQAQARANIGIGSTANKFVHFSLDDCTFWADLITNESNYSSCFQNSVLARLQYLHNLYGTCFTLNCFIVSGAQSIADVPNKWAAEFAANKDWLRFAFHGTTTDELFSNTDADVLLGYYNTFVAAIFKMTGTYDCIDRVTRLSSYTGNTANIAALVNAKCGITGLLTNDRNVLLSVGTSYDLTAAQNQFMHTHDKMCVPEKHLWYFRTMLRLENANIMPDVLNTADYANFRPIIEIFWHETTGWNGNYAYNTWQKPWFDALKANGYDNVFTSDLFKIN